jgi:hypothetical protein
MDCNRHDKNTYQMIEHWFEVVGRVLADPAIERECVQCGRAWGHAFHVWVCGGSRERRRPAGL